MPFFSEALHHRHAKHLGELEAEISPHAPGPNRLDEVLIVPELKLLFCFIPKNACTQFNRLMNALNGLNEFTGQPCHPRDPNYRSSMTSPVGFRGTIHGKYNRARYDEILRDPSWTKAVFLRDPMERLVSGYLSKCYPPQECRGRECMNFPGTSNTTWPTFAQFVSKIELGVNGHFSPQSRMCGGLGDVIQFYDYVGHISRDYSDVNRQVYEMLNQAITKRNTQGHASSMNIHGFSASLTGDRLESNTSAYAKRVADQFFPPAGPPSKDSHIHRGTQLNKYY